MGLDMYLHYRKHMSGYEFTDDKGSSYREVLAASGVSTLADSGTPHMTVDVCVMYWRKANAIHGWFVNELGGGVDECQQIHVTRDNLIDLRNLCFEAMSVPAGSTMEKHAEEVLPPTSGFFFGSSEIDDWYFEDLKQTIEGIDRVLANLPEEGEGWDWSLYYQASW